MKSKKKIGSKVCPASRCSALLGVMATPPKSSDNTDIITFQTMDNTGMKLAEMDDYPGAMAVLVESLKRKGVRFDESRFKHGDIIHKNKYVTVIRDDAAEFLHRVYERLESGRAGLIRDEFHDLREDRLKRLGDVEIGQIHNVTPNYVLGGAFCTYLVS